MSEKFKYTELKDDAFYNARSYYFDLAYYNAVGDYIDAYIDFPFNDDSETSQDIEYEEIKDDVDEWIKILTENQWFDKTGELIDAKEITKETPLITISDIISENLYFLISNAYQEIIYVLPDIQKYARGETTEHILNDFEWIRTIIDQMVDEDLSEKEKIIKFAEKTEKEIEDYMFIGGEHYLWLVYYLFDNNYRYDTDYHIIKKFEI